jgi:dTMP kinase
MFITFEGPEGGGKSTQARLLAEQLQREIARPVLLVREPGGTPIGDQIRTILHDLKNTEMDAHAELLLYSASRAQLVSQVIGPHLARGGVVLCDRYADSTIAYQGYGRGLDREALAQITAFATGGLTPDLTLFLDIDPARGLARRKQGGEEWNRMDALELAFHTRVREGYRMLIANQPERWVTIDADKPPEAVQHAILTAVRSRLDLRD